MAIIGGICIVILIIVLKENYFPDKIKYKNAWTGAEEQQ